MVMSGLGIAHRRGGYRDPESQAFIESWFSKLKEPEVWRNEYQTLEDVRRGIGGYIERYHERPHSSLDYRIPTEVAKTWENGQALSKQAPEVSTPERYRPVVDAGAGPPRP